MIIINSTVNKNSDFKRIIFMYMNEREMNGNIETKVCKPSDS